MALSRGDPQPPDRTVARRWASSSRRNRRLARCRRTGRTTSQRRGRTSRVISTGLSSHSQTKSPMTSASRSAMRSPIRVPRMLCGPAPVGLRSATSASVGTEYGRAALPGQPTRQSRSLNHTTGKRQPLAPRELGSLGSLGKILTHAPEEPTAPARRRRQSSIRLLRRIHPVGADSVVRPRPARPGVPSSQTSPILGVSAGHFALHVGRPSPGSPTPSYRRHLFPPCPSRHGRRRLRACPARGPPTSAGSPTQ